MIVKITEDFVTLHTNNKSTFSTLNIKKLYPCRSKYITERKPFGIGNHLPNSFNPRQSSKFD